MPRSRQDRLVHLINDLEVGGAEMALYRLLSRMDRVGFSIVVVSLNGVGGLGEKIRALGVPVYGLGMKRRMSDVRKLFSLARLLRSLKPAVLHCWMYNANLLGFLAAWFSGRPLLIWSIRSSYKDIEDYRRITKWIIKVGALLSRFCSAIVVNSKVGLDSHIAAGYDQSRMRLIPNGFDLDLFRPLPGARAQLREELGLPTSTLLIGMVARYRPPKDHRNLFQAAKYLLQKSSKVAFVLVGGGMDANNQELQGLMDGSVRDRVFFMGEREDVPRVLAGLDILTLSSYREGFPNVIGEAMACGVPCVVTDAGDSASLVGDTGRVVPPRDPLSLAAAWEDLIALGHEKRAQLGAAARTRIEELFSLGTIAGYYEELYKDLMERSEGGEKNMDEAV